MKKITLVVLFAAVCQLQAQNKLLSSVDQFDNSGTFENSYGYNYEYDANDNLITQSGYNWNSSTGNWELQDRESYAYNAARKATTLVYQQYNSTTGNFENSYRDLYTYNANDDISEVVYQEFVTGAYQNEFRLTTSYNGSQLSSFIEYNWNGAQWVESDRGTLSYNSNGTLASIIAEEYVNGQYQLDYKDSFFYDSNNRLVQKLFEIWDGSSYVLDEQIDLTLDNNGNLITETVDYDQGTSGPNFKETYSYDTSQLMSNFAHPFRDKTGLEYLFDDFPYVNKLLELTYQGYNSDTDAFEPVTNKTIYNYNTTLRVAEADIPTVFIQVFPNPTADVVNVISSNFDIDHVEVFGILGNKLLTTNEDVVSLKSLPTGMYFLNIYNNSGDVSSHKIIKE